ncbi:MAG: TetR/AcrR family transcriptional regulator, partial [Microlunatus sp.]|nr:TetR/AcrR family transcriptional regulator [Microlunatus sp.]
MSTPRTDTAGYRRSAGTARGRQRQEELLERVTDDLAENGLAGFSLRRAARAAGTTHKVLLYHFDGVEDLLGQALLRLRARRVDNALAVAAEGHSSLAARVRAIWPVLAEDATGLRVIDQAIGLAMYDPEHYAHLARDAAAHLGESGGEPRQVVRVREQLADLRAALAFARTLPEVDPGRVACWGFSLSGGHLFRLAAGTDAPAAVIAQSPAADFLVASPNALRHETLGVALRFPLIAIADVIGGLVRRTPRLIPLAGPRGAMAMLTTPDAADGARALDPDGRYPQWRQVIAARSVLPLMSYRPGRA